MSGCWQRQLAGKVGQRLERGARPLVDLRGGLGRHPRAFLDQLQCRARIERARSKLSGSVLEPLAELDQGIGHG